MAFGHGDRKNVPSVFRENISGEKVDLVSGVWKAPAIHHPDSVVLPVRVRGRYGLDLNSPEKSSRANNYVVAVAFSPRFGNREAQAGSFAHESEFRELAARFGFEFDFE